MYRLLRRCTWRLESISLVLDEIYFISLEKVIIQISMDTVDGESDEATIMWEKDIITKIKIVTTSKIKT